MGTTEPFSVEAADGATLRGHRWVADGDARAVIALAHGLGEHSLRYAPLAEELNRAGFDVVACDHRGHGLTAGGDENLGKFGPRGWNGVVDDYSRVVAKAGETQPGRPVVALGHSLGSFVLQSFLLDHSGDVAAGVLSGSAALDQLANLLDPTVEVDLSLFNAPFQPARTDFDWLSRDPEQVDLYINDPWCGFGLDPDGVGSLKDAAARTADPEALGQIRDGFPLYVLAGSADPINIGLQWLEILVDRYRDHGLEVTAKYYDEGRHEMFNETNRAEVFADLIAWLDSVPALKLETRVG